MCYWGTKNKRHQQTVVEFSIHRRELQRHKSSHAISKLIRIYFYGKGKKDNWATYFMLICANSVPNIPTKPVFVLLSFVCVRSLKAESSNGSFRQIFCGIFPTTICRTFPIFPQSKRIQTQEGANYSKGGIIPLKLKIFSTALSL